MKKALFSSHYTSNFLDVVLDAQKNNAKKPQVIIIHTTKGKGIKAFENDPSWHARKIKGEELEIGKKELGIA